MHIANRSRALSSDLAHARGRQQGHDSAIAMRGCLFAEESGSDWEGMYVVRGVHACFVDLSTSCLADLASCNRCMSLNFYDVECKISDL